MHKPELTDAFIRNAIASGAIVPPSGEPSSPGYRILAVTGWFMAFLAAMALATAYYLS
jgi:hypothetical protein